MRRLVVAAVCLSSPGVAWAGDAPSEGASTLEVRAAQEGEDDRPWLGLQIDAGVPDGANVAVVWRPWHWLRFHGGGAYNMVGFGVRGGVSLLPLDAWLTPSLVVEGGHFFEGDLQGFVATLAGEAPDGTPRDVRYDYGNLHLGLELGSPDFTFYLRGGYSLVDATVVPDTESPADNLRFERDAHVRALTPSGKLGFVVYML